jgi:hypothetical protein
MRTNNLHLNLLASRRLLLLPIWCTLEPRLKPNILVHTGLRRRPQPRAGGHDIEDLRPRKAS